MIFKQGIRRLRGVAAGAVALALLTAGSAATAPSASADAFGQLSTWGSPGTGAGQLKTPGTFALDRADDSSYIVDSLTPESAGYQLREFSSAGAQLGRVTLARNEVSGWPEQAPWIAVDHPSTAAPGLVYVLRDQFDETTEAFRALRIQIFSTTPNGSGELVAPATGPATLTLPTGSGTVYNPGGLAFDPSTGNLIVAGVAADGKALLQVVKPDGTLGTRWQDETGVLSSEFTFGGSEPWGLAVADDGTVFLEARPAAGGEPKVYELPAGFTTSSTLTAIPGIHGLESSEQAFFRPRGPQIAVSPDGSTLYYSSFKGTEFETGGRPGNYLVHGYSIAAGRDQYLYGDGDASACRLKALGPAIAAADDTGRIVVLEHDNGELPAPYGDRVVEFGPGGSGCPFPATSVKVNGSTSPAAVSKGANVVFEAAGNELHGAEPTELIWTATGPEGFTKAVTGSPAALKLEHKFLKVGSYTVKLEMKTTSALGDPVPVTKTLVVQGAAPLAQFIASTSSPAAGATVEFDASESVDPAGSPTGGPTFQLAKYHWEFGDGSASVDTTQPTTSHAFDNSGSGVLGRTVTLTVTNAEGLTGSVSQTIDVQGMPGSDPGQGGGSQGSTGGQGSPAPSPTPTPIPSPAPKPTPKPHPLVCKKGFKKKKVKGKPKCVKLVKHKAHHK